MTENIRSCYIAFDRYPSSKGSATHIREMIDVLSSEVEPMLLLSIVGSEPDKVRNYVHHTFGEPIQNFLRRTEKFEAWVRSKLKYEHHLELIHFRDLWGGMAAIEKGNAIKIFEVNAVPSIELPYHFPQVSKEVIEKLEEKELACLEGSDHIIVPSQVIQKYLHKRGINPEKITLIPNGAHPIEALPRPSDIKKPYFIYFGALQSWQGIQVLMKAMQYLDDLKDVRLLICSSQRYKAVKKYHRWAEQLNISEKLIWRYELPKDELNQYIQHSIASMAPLTDCSRNVEQGCSPLKVLESMANKVPIIASDLPVVNEIIGDRSKYLPVPPDRPAELSRAMRKAFDQPVYYRKMAQELFHHLEETYLWSKQKDLLRETYSRLLQPNYH